MRLAILGRTILAFMILGVFVYLGFEFILGRIGLGGMWIYLASGSVMLGILVLPLIIFRIYKKKKAKREMVRVRANEILPEPCPNCKTPLVHHQQYGFYCENCLKYIDL
jgi:hypothetical protein